VDFGAVSYQQFLILWRVLSFGFDGWVEILIGYTPGPSGFAAVNSHISPKEGEIWGTLGFRLGIRLFPDTGLAWLQNRGLDPLPLGSWSQEAARSMSRNWIAWFALAGTSWLASAQQTCTAGIHVEGTITDPAGAVIPGARVQAQGTTVITDAAGHYVIGCASANTTITAQASGFADGSVRIPAQAAGKVQLNIRLAVAAALTDVQVSGNSDNNSGGDTTTLNSKAVQGLADDPDDFLRELQVLASEAGGDPTQTIVMVDGFQNPSAQRGECSHARRRWRPGAEWKWRS
jgi:hypothetical protein